MQSQAVQLSSLNVYSAIMSGEFKENLITHKMIGLYLRLDLLRIKMIIDECHYLSRNNKLAHLEFLLNVNSAGNFNGPNYFTS
jgi:hypothetical protein